MLTDLDHLRASVADIQRTRQFYHEDLGLLEICAGETELPAALGGGPCQATVFQVGPTLVELFQVPAGVKAGLVQHLGIRSDDFETDPDAYLDGENPDMSEPGRARIVRRSRG